jgi:hypothetical protein
MVPRILASERLAIRTLAGASVEEVTVKTKEFPISDSDVVFPTDAFSTAIV